MAEHIVLVRHGETEWSLSGQHTSHTDLSLTEAGRERARALQSELGEWSFARVVSSPLKRALETCELSGFGDRAELDDDLREWDYGEYEGLTTPQIRQESPGWSLWRDGGFEAGARSGAATTEASACGRTVMAAASYCAAVLFVR